MGIIWIGNVEIVIVMVYIYILCFFSECIWLYNRDLWGSIFKIKYLLWYMIFWEYIFVEKSDKWKDMSFVVFKVL